MMALVAFIVGLLAPAPAPATLTEEQKWNLAYALAEKYFVAKDYPRSRDEFRRLHELATLEADRIPVRFMLARCDEMSGQLEAAVHVFEELSKQTVDADVAKASAEKLPVLTTGLGSVRVPCEYELAQVTLSGRESDPQRCPAHFARVQPGPRTITLKGRFDRTSRAEVVVTAGTETSARLPAPAMLELRAEPASAAIQLEGEPVSQTGPIRVIPGYYKALARAPHHKDAVQDITVDAGAVRRIELKLEPNVLVVREAEPRGPWPWVVIGGGGAVVGSGFVFLYLNQKNLEYEEQAREIHDPDVTEYRDDAARFQALTIAAYVAGGLTAGAGLAWLLWPQAEATPTPPVTVVPTPGGLGLVGRF